VFFKNTYRIEGWVLANCGLLEVFHRKWLLAGFDRIFGWSKM